MNKFEISIPKGASLILRHDPNAPIPQLSSVPPAEQPPVANVFFAFRIMVGIGLFMIGAAWLGSLLWWRGALNPVAAFWAAYVLTRPLGASVADWLGKPPAQSGLGLGDGVVSGLGLVLFAGLVAYLALTRRDVQGASHEPHATQGALVVQPAES